MGSWKDRMNDYCSAKDNITCIKNEKGQNVYKGCIIQKSNNEEQQPTCKPYLSSSKKYILEGPFLAVNDNILKQKEKDRNKKLEHYLKIFKKDDGTSEELYVKRSNGDIEKGWFIDKDKPVFLDRVPCVWTDGDDIITKIIPIDDLIEVNTELIKEKEGLIFLNYLNNTQENIVDKKANKIDKLIKYCDQKTEDNCEKTDGKYKYKGCIYENNKCIPSVDQKNIFVSNLEPPFLEEDEDILNDKNNERKKKYEVFQTWFKEFIKQNGKKKTLKIKSEDGNILEDTYLYDDSTGPFLKPIQIENGKIKLINIISNYKPKLNKREFKYVDIDEIMELNK